MHPKLIDQINEAVAEASREQGKVEIHCDHPNQIRVQIYRGLDRSRFVTNRAGVDQKASLGACLKRLRSNIPGPSSKCASTGCICSNRLTHSPTTRFGSNSLTPFHRIGIKGNGFIGVVMPLRGK